MHQQNRLPNPEEVNRLMAKASATAFLLLEKETIRITLGDLSQSGFDTMAAAMQRYWSGLIPQGINRTVGLSLDQKFVFLFAKFLPDSKTMLGLVFPLHTPLIRIRQDMTHLMRLFLDQPGLDSDPDRGLEQSLQSLDIIGPMPDPELHQLPGIWELEITELPEEAPVKEEHFSAHQEKISRPPKPEPWLETTDAPWQAAETAPESLPYASDWRPLKEEKLQDEDLVSILQDKYQTQENRPSSKVDQVPSVEKAQSAQPEKKTQLEDTQPCRPYDVQGEEEIQTVSDVTFYLVPASTSHFLIGELSVWLKRWMPALCETYGWQLEYLSVRPDYIKWTLVDFPEALIRKMLQVVRQQTSGRIFRVFPNLKADNASGDFWAPGYLVDTQDREFTTQALMIHLAANQLTA